MAITSTAVWELRTTATAGNVNGGFYKPGASGVDYSQQNAAQYPLTGGTSVGAGSDILHASAAADMVGNGIHVISGTNATAGWYEIISVSVGVSITVDRAVTTGVGASIVANVGGGLSDGSASPLTTAVVAGNTVYIKAGTYTVAGATNWNWGALAGTTSLQCHVIGYNSTHGDNPTGSNRPQVNFGTGVFLTGTNNTWMNLSFSSAHAASNEGTAFISGGGGTMINCKFINTTTTANIPSVGVSSNMNFFGCEFASYFGYGLVMPSGGIIVVINCWFHDSPYGLFTSYTGGANNAIVTGCTFSACYTAGIHSASGSSFGVGQFINNTFYGGETTKIGIGFNFPGSTGQRATIYNNIFYGLATGLLLGQTNAENFNNYSNNTADVSGFTKGANDLALSPSFSSVGQYTGTTATSSGSVLTDSGAAFTNVVAGRDFLYVSAMTGGSGPGVYGITTKSATTITTDNALGSGTSITYSIIYGQNFAVGTNMKAVGNANTGNPLSVGYLDLGAVQRQELGGSGGVSRGRIVNAS